MTAGLTLMGVLRIQFLQSGDVNTNHGLFYQNATSIVGKLQDLTFVIDQYYKTMTTIKRLAD